MVLKVILTLIFGATSVWAIVDASMEIIGLWGIFRKCGIKPALSLVPCLRLYYLGLSVAREPEGWMIFINHVLITLSSLLMLFLPSTSSVYLLISPFVLVFAIIELVYSIRVYIALLELFQARRRWLILAIPVFGIVAIIFGWTKKYQPQWKVTDYQEQAAGLSGATARVMDEGLTVNLEERSVTSFFKKKYLLRDIHMYIKPGSMVLLLGGSGAGKTTFLNAVNGYERANAKVVLNSGDVYADYKKMQYEIGFVPQQDLMRGSDTVLRTLSDAALLRLPIDLPQAQRKKRIMEVMEIFGLEPVAGSLVDKLSGGQRKRLSIAMEFISNPSLFILDEPDSGLDGVMARELFERLRAIADQGKIIIVITHTPDRVIDLFDNVIVLAKDANRTGRLAYYGSIDDARGFFGKQRMEEIVMCINRQEEGGEGRADEFIGKFAEVQHA